VRARWEAGLRAVVHVRGFELAVDEPAADGGTDTGPMPTEYLLGSLAACYALALAWAARKRQWALPPFTVDVAGTYDGPAFRRFEIVVRFDGRPPDEVETLVESAKRACYVSNTLRRASEIDVVVADA
jgi:putative redox protein